MTQILWSTDPATQRAIACVLGLAFLTAVTIHLPLALRALALWRLERRLRPLLSSLSNGGAGEDAGGAGEALREILRESRVASSFHEFERRWQTAQIAEGLGRAPIRLLDVLDEHPLLPFGPRRSLLPVLPGLFLAIGVFATLVGLIPSLGALGQGEMPAGAASSWMAEQLGLALRVSAWGFLCAMAASLGGRLIEGAFEARAHGLDEIVEAAYGSVSPGELAELTRQTQQKSLDTLGIELTRFASELSERLERGLQRIEHSSAQSASLVSQEQRGALHAVVQELSLSVRQGVEHHLGELRSALQRTVEHQSSVTSGLAETFQRMVENSQTQDRVARTLHESAQAVDQAARTMRTSSVEMQPMIEHLGGTSRALADTADRIDSTQKVVARTAESVRSSLEYAATGVDDQRQLLEVSLGEVRRTLVGLEDGLSQSLQRALREVDGTLSSTVGVLRDTLAESNETIDRLAQPIRAAEGTTRETHVALDRVRTEVEALGQWMSQTAKPLRAGLDDVESRAQEIARALADFSGHSRQMDKTMEALRLEIHEESRRLQATGSDLGRRLKLASDAVGLLESTTSDAARRSRPATPATGGLDRERHWSPTPLPSDRSASPRPVKRAPDDSEEAHRRSTLPEPTSVPTSGPASSESAPKTLEQGERTLSGYRVGAPRAQGPDPYERFGDSAAPASNLRHLPTPDRELGEDLKLSGLLGPSSHRDPEPREVRASSPYPNEPADTEPDVEQRPTDDRD